MTQWVPRDATNVLVLGDPSSLPSLVEGLRITGIRPSRITVIGNPVPEEISRQHEDGLVILRGTLNTWTQRIEARFFDVAIAAPWDNAPYVVEHASKTALLTIAAVPTDWESDAFGFLDTYARIRRRAMIHGGGCVVELKRCPRDEARDPYAMISERWSRKDPISVYTGPLPTLYPDGREPPDSPLFQR
jgi:hypothetical protein